MIRRQPNINRDVAIAISGVDQRIRDAIQNLWLALPREEATITNLEEHFRRLVDRAIRDLKEDMNYFPPKFNKNKKKNQL